MSLGDWNFLAGRLTGDGNIEVVETELPINISSIARNLSSPSAMDGTITNSVRRLKAAGRPIFEPWNTVLIAEASGIIRGMSIYQKPQFTGAEWQLQTIGMSGYPLGMPYDGEISFTGVDPLDVFRHIWAHLQSFPGGNLGVTVSDLRSGIKLGGPEVDPLTAKHAAAKAIRDRLAVHEDDIFEDWTWYEQPPGVNDWNDELVKEYGGNTWDRPAGVAWLDKWMEDHPPPTDPEKPRKLNWWETTDLGAEIDNLAKEAPFDWVEQVGWQGDQPHCHIDLGYPTIGSRKENLRLVLGENMASIPSVTEADYVNGAWVFGAGEGRERIRGRAGVADGRLRRLRVIEDKGISQVPQADARARDEMNATRGQFLVDTVEVFNHPNAPLEAIELGDEIPLYAETDHVLVDTSVRVVGKEESPQNSDVASLTVVRMMQA